MKKCFLVVSLLLIIGLSLQQKNATIVKAENVILENDDRVASDLVLQEKIKSELNGEIISYESLPKNVIPLRFNSVEEAKVFIDNYGVNNYNFENSNENRLIFTRNASDTDIKSKSIAITTIFSVDIQTINIFAKYKYAKNNFKEVVDVTSSYTGVTLGSEWNQDSFSSDITKKGKKLSVTVYGHFDFYVLIKTTLTKVGSENRTFSASWNY